MTEEEFLKDYWRIRGDIDFLIDAFYANREFNKIVSEDTELHNAVNRNGRFWNVQQYALQSAFFIMLARLLDVDPKFHSLHKLLAAMVGNVEFFTKGAFAARKIKEAGGERPEWLDDRLNHVWEPSVPDIRKIKKSLAPHKTKFDAVYAPIRHTFAHLIYRDPQELSELFGKAVYAEIEELLYFLDGLMESVFHLLYNGKRPEGITRAAFQTRIDRAKDATREMLNTLKAGETVGKSSTQTVGD